jgi:pimeloyl-ACP methyl ester carboxylesterase
MQVEPCEFIRRFLLHVLPRGFVRIRHHGLLADCRREGVTAPVLVIHGVADVVPLAGARDWAASYPDARLLLMHPSGHLVHLEEPAVFFAAVEECLDGRWPAAAETISSH